MERKVLLALEWRRWSPLPSRAGDALYKAALEECKLGEDVVMEDLDADEEGWVAEADAAAVEEDAADAVAAAVELPFLDPRAEYL